MPTSHTEQIPLSPLLALICLGIARRFRPDWVSVRIEDAAQSVAVSPERASRLVTRAVDLFAPVLAGLTRRGRPPRDSRAERLAVDLAVTQALLEITTAILARIPLRRRVVGDFVVGAWRRLSAEHGVTQARFCAALSLSPRTLRHWLSSRPPSRTASTESPIASAPAPRRRTRPGRRRFGFDVVLPDTQIAADTTGLSAFGVPLKLVAAQDVGGRDQDLLDSIIIDERECADHVIAVLQTALDGSPGGQVITDQGTPYMAEATKKAADALEAEHAPQREGDPQGKATLERAFGTVKSLAGPLLDLTNQLASTWPKLVRADLAKPTAKLVIASLLRAYRAGARATRTACAERNGTDPETLARLAEESRERARARDRSARLLLEHIHEIYEVGGSRTAFVRRFRHYPQQVLRKAELDFASQVHRDDIKNRVAYFAAIVRRGQDEYERHQRRRAREAREEDRRAEERARDERQQKARREDPASAIHKALELLVGQWDAVRGTLKFGGAGLPRGWIRAAIRNLRELHGRVAAADVTRGVFNAFADKHAHDQPLTQAVADLLDGILQQELQPTDHAPDNEPPAAVILHKHITPRRPTPHDLLRNYPAKPGAT